MWRYVPNRLLQAILLLLGIATLAYFAKAFWNWDQRKNHRRNNHSTVTVLSTDGDEFVLSPNAADNPQFLVFLPLVRDEPQFDRPQPTLAERWEHSDDGRTWTFYLRRGLKWHDGQPVTARDVKFTMDLWSHPAVQNVIGEPLEKVTVVDDYTIQAVQKTPGRQLLSSWYVFYPKHLLEGLDPQDFVNWRFWTEPVGNGPYQYVRHVAKTMLELKAYPEYYKGAPRIERVVFKFNGGVPLTELVSGNVDAVEYFNPSEAPKLGNDPRFRTFSAPLPRRVQIYWNVAHPLFENSSIRRALTMAIDRRELHRQLNFPDNLPLTDGVYSMRQFWQRSFDKPLDFDPKTAAQLLQKAGWVRPHSRGFYERDGDPFRFRLLVPRVTGQSLYPAAILVQDQLHRFGIKMEIEPLESLVARQRIRAGEFEAGLHWTGTFPFGQEEYLGEDSTYGRNNPKLIKLMDKAMQEVDLDELDRTCRKLSEIVRKDLPVTFLFPEVFSSFVHRRIQGLSSPFRVSPVLCLEDLWLEDDE